MVALDKGEGTMRRWVRTLRRGHVVELVACMALTAAVFGLMVGALGG